MARKLIDFDPNARWTKRTYRVTLGAGTYRRSFLYTIYGNCKEIPGAYELSESFPMHGVRAIKYDEDCDMLSFTMRGPDGVCDFEVSTDEFAEMIIGIQLVAFGPDDRKVDSEVLPVAQEGGAK